MGGLAHLLEMRDLAVTAPLMEHPHDVLDHHYRAVPAGSVALYSGYLGFLTIFILETKVNRNNVLIALGGFLGASLREPT